LSWLRRSSRTPSLIMTVEDDILDVVCKYCAANR
jgi:septum formation topological specificity factor MinE